MDERGTARLVAVAVLAFLLFDHPLLGLSDGAPVLGVPLPLLYLFGAWALVVALVRRATRD